MVTDKQLSPVGGSSVPVPNRMLRLLKKATTISDLCPREDLGKDGVEEEEEEEMRSDLEGLNGEEEEEEDGVNARKALDFDSVPAELNPAIEEEVISDLETREETKVSESSVPEIYPASEELGEKGEDEISEMEMRVSELSVPEIDPAAPEEMGEKGEEEISDLETRDEARVSESSVPEIDSTSEELGEKSEEEISDLKTREETRASELGEKGEDDDEVSEMETEEGINGWGSKGVRKKRQVLEGASDSQRKDKKRSKKNIDFDELPASMNMTKKVPL